MQQENLAQRRRYFAASGSLAGWLALMPVLAIGQSVAVEDFLGIWSGVFTTQDSEFWMVEDFLTCFAGCSVGARAYFEALLEDPANDERPVRELAREATGFARRELAEKSTEAGLALQAAGAPEDDLTSMCAPYGLARQAINPLPLAIRRDGPNLVIQYEEWNLSRRIYLDGRELPAEAEPSLLGYSVGRIEGDALVIESNGLEANIYFGFHSGGGHSDQATVLERYTLAADPHRLLLEMTLTDPVTLTEPQVMSKIWLATPDLELVEDSCRDVPGQF
jgi:hypothetical protein